jgi:sugar-phosphatase
MPFDAVIFDMDGLLIDSEPFWQTAEIEVFGRLGLNLSHEQSTETIGMRLKEVVAHRFDHQPWNGHSQQKSPKQYWIGLLNWCIRRANRNPV